MLSQTRQQQADQHLLIQENVVIDGAGRPLLTDFGITSVFEYDYAVSSSRYMAPELLNNERSYSTTASDVYMFGCVCYEVHHLPLQDILSIK